jgi:hypothetical protein
MSLKDEPKKITERTASLKTTILTDYGGAAKVPVQQP